MELIDRVNGFGQVMLTAPEQSMLGELSKIASTAGKSYILGEMNEQTGRYERIMKDLFPMVPLLRGAGLEGNYQNSYSLRFVLPKNVWYQELPDGPELQIGSRIGIGNEVRDIDLRVLLPSLNAAEESYFMSVMVGEHHRRGCIDDIVAKLGEREDPIILGIQPIKNKAPVNPNYGIAEVPQFRTVLKLYEQAAHLLRHAEDTIHIIIQELHTLREDMMEHENIAVRKLSAVEYQKVLEALTHQ